MGILILHLESCVLSSLPCEWSSFLPSFLLLSLMCLSKKLRFWVTRSKECEEVKERRATGERRPSVCCGGRCDTVQPVQASEAGDRSKE